MPDIGRFCNEFAAGSSRRLFRLPASWGFVVQNARLLGAFGFSLQNRPIPGTPAWWNGYARLHAW